MRLYNSCLIPKNLSFKNSIQKPLLLKRCMGSRILQENGPQVCSQRYGENAMRKSHTNKHIGLSVTVLLMQFGLRILTLFLMIIRCSLWQMETDSSCLILWRWFLRLRILTMLLQQLSHDVDKFTSLLKTLLSNKCIKAGCNREQNKKLMDQQNWLRIQYQFCSIKKSSICWWTCLMFFSMRILYWKFLRKKSKKKILYSFQAQLRLFRYWICLVDIYCSISHKSRSKNYPKKILARY